MHIASYFISVSCTVQSISLIVANKSLPEPCTEQIPDPSWGTSQASSLLEMVLDWAVSIADKKREPICIMRVKEGVPKVSQELPPTLPPTLTCSAPSIASPPPPRLLHRAWGIQGPQPSATEHRAPKPKHTWGPVFYVNLPKHQIGTLCFCAGEEGMKECGRLLEKAP